MTDDVELCPACNLRPARPRAKGRHCEPCANRLRYQDDDAWRERIRDRERDRQRKVIAERKAAGPQFFTPPES